MSIEDQFQKWKDSFIIHNFANNIYFTAMSMQYREDQPYPPELNIWTAQPIESLKTMKHL